MRCGSTWIFRSSSPKVRGGGLVTLKLMIFPVAKIKLFGQFLLVFDIIPLLLAFVSTMLKINCWEPTYFFHIVV